MGWRSLFALVTSGLLLSVAFAAAPPAPVPAEWLRLIEHLGEDEKRDAAAKKLDELGDAAIPVLRRAGKTHRDVDVRLRATVIAARIEQRLYGEVRRFGEQKSDFDAFTLSPDGKRVACGSGSRVASVWDVQTGKQLFLLTGHTGAIDCVDWSADGKQILTGSRDGTLRLWDAEKGDPVRTTEREHRGGVEAVLFSPDGKKALSCGFGAYVSEWDLATGKLLRRIEILLEGGTEQMGLRGLAWVPGGKRFVTAARDGSVLVIDAATGKEVQRMQRHHGNGARAVAVSPDGKWIASCGETDPVFLFDAESGKYLRWFDGPKTAARTVAFSRCGKRLLTGGEDVRLWDVETGREMQRMGEDSETVIFHVAFTPDDRHALFCAGKTLSLWKVRK
jgi:WD40 repeat protein